MSHPRPPSLAVSASTEEALERGRALFNRGDAFEAHEAWEEAWRREAGTSRALLQGLIQVAAAYYKARVEGNAVGAVMLFEMGLERLGAIPDGTLGLCLDVFRRSVAADLERARAWAGGASRSFIPLVEPHLDRA